MVPAHGWHALFASISFFPATSLFIAVLRNRLRLQQKKTNGGAVSTPSAFCDNICNLLVLALRTPLAHIAPPSFQACHTFFLMPSFTSRTMQMRAGVTKKETWPRRA